MSNSLPASLNRAFDERSQIPFVDFCRIALYDSEDGYYRREKLRAGADHKADFVTNLAVRSVFAPLVLGAIETLLKGKALGDYRFVEVAAEPETSLLASGEHPFANAEVVRLGAPIPHLEGKVIVFANEWLDARPFVRMVFGDGRWGEAMVMRGEDGELVEEIGGIASEDARALVKDLPPTAPEGYRLDLSVEAETVLDDYLSQEWEGLFLTFDYGSSWEALLRDFPQGCGRSYRGQQQGNNLLAAPGEQDLTCNVCWDRLASVLQKNRFIVGGPRRQEAFFFENASDTIREIIEGGSSDEARTRRSKAMQLLNPAHFGAAFQALWGVRG